jgi:glyoxylase-like metal-dependent hydrolase (beta-lactamase superfamily II)
LSVIKSFAVGNGDSYYIRHGSDSFTIIDCNLVEEHKERIVEEIEAQKRDKSISRFISTHPDEDHIRGLSYLDQESSIVNFYCVENEATKEEETVDFMKYCELRDSDKAFNLYAGCSRKWLNKKDDERGSAGITIMWPDVENERYQEELEKARKGISFNNISAII